MAAGELDVDDNRLSRRTALKGLGAGAAAAWTVPTVLSTTAASAASVIAHPCAPGDCAGDPCFDAGPCGSDSGSGNPCFCFPDPVSGVCTCTQVIGCLAASAPVAGVCPPGYAAQLSCCGGTLCFPICA